MESNGEKSRIQCEICFRPFSSKKLSRLPMVGNCGHSCCRYCARQLNGKCAHCRKPIKLEKNYSLIESLAKMEEMNKKIKKMREQLTTAGLPVEDMEESEESAEEEEDFVEDERQWRKKKSAVENDEHQNNDDEDDEVQVVAAVRYLFDVDEQEDDAEIIFDGINLRQPRANLARQAEDEDHVEQEMERNAGPRLHPPQHDAEDNEQHDSEGEFQAGQPVVSRTRSSDHPRSASNT